jgi:hypothetical protein
VKAKNDWESPRDPWIGVDLDGTLAQLHTVLPWNVFGPPIPRMVERVKAWVASGHTVRIITARVFPYIHGNPAFNHAYSYSQQCLVTGEMFKISQMLQVIREYTEEHVGTALDATCAKDYRMLQFWDDRAVQVVANTGMTLAEEMVAKAVAEQGRAQG